MKKKKILMLLLVTVLMFAFSITTSAAKVKLNKTKVTINVGSTVKLNVTGTKKKAKWSTSSEQVATVNKNGYVTGRGEGKATITAKVGKKKYKCAVTVKSASTSPESMTVSQKNAVEKAKSYLRYMAFSRTGLIGQLEYEGKEIILEVRYEF